VAQEDMACLAFDDVTSETGNQDLQVRRIFGKFQVQVGNLEPIDLPSICIDKFAPIQSGDKLKNYNDRLILGRLS
jgi:hypothetical protein